MLQGKILLSPSSTLKYICLIFRAAYCMNQWNFFTSAIFFHRQLPMKHKSMHSRPSNINYSRLSFCECLRLNVGYVYTSFFSFFFWLYNILLDILCVQTDSQIINCLTFFRIMSKYSKTQMWNIYWWLFFWFFFFCATLILCYRE